MYIPEVMMWIMLGISISVAILSVYTSVKEKRDAKSAKDYN